MMRSLYSAISGLKNHQTMMDTIGNNIANVNTVGYKRSRVTFGTMLSQELKGASAPTQNQGGTNPIQVGLGATLGSIDKVMTQGSTQSTGKNTDMMIQGSGFFVLNNNGQTVYSRAGAFSQDKDGNLVDPATGAYVQGYSWGADDSVAPSWSGAGFGAIKFGLGDSLPMDSSVPATITNTAVTAADPAWSAGPPATITIAGLIGASNVSISGLTQVPYTQTPNPGEFSLEPWTGKLTFSTKPATDFNVDSVDPVTLDNTVGTGNLVGNDVTVKYPPAPGATIFLNGTGTNDSIAYTEAPSLAELNNGNYYWVDTTGGQYKISFSNNATALDGTTAVAAPPNGNTISYDFINQPHTLTSFSIDGSGVITGVYSDGTTSVTHKIAQIAIAGFPNDAGLENVGNNFYISTNNSGNPSVGSAAQNGRGTIVPGAVEMSNVDLSQEFTDMIVAQRGFQANSRVITVSDTLLQELIDLKRQ